MMSLEQRVQSLEKVRRSLMGLVVIALIGVAISGVWAVAMSRKVSRLAAGDTAFDALAVRSLLVENDEGHVVAFLSASNGNPIFNMYDDEGHSMIDIHVADNGPQVLLSDASEEVRLMLTTHQDAGGAVYVFNHHDEMCSALAADDYGSGIVATFSGNGEPLTFMGRGADQLGSVAVYGKGAKRMELARRPSTE